jgi:DNA-binding MarR family transcriptional regulator
MDLFVCHRSALGHHGVVYQSTLRARLGITRATLTVMLRRMEKRGFVERRRCSVDRRKLIVTITPAGYAAFEKARHLVDDGVYREIVDANLLFIDFKEPVPQKRARFLLYVDTLRTHFGDFTEPPYPIEKGFGLAAMGGQVDPMQQRVDDLLRKYVIQ